MGVSLEVYRGRIGVFSANCAGKGAYVPSTSGSGPFGLSFKKIPVATLLILLMISGIELNPGPNFTCKVCPTSFESVSKYFKHGLMHKSDKHFSVRCPYDKCASKVTTLDSLKTHLSRCHGTASSISASAAVPVSIGAVPLKCPVCDVSLSSRTEYMSHMRDELKTNVSFVCAYSNCNYEVKKATLFSSHMSRYHPFIGHEDQSASFEPNICDVEPVSDDRPGDVGSDHDDDGNEDTSDRNEDGDDSTDCYPPYAVKDEVAKFYLKLESVFNLPTSTVQAIAEEVKLMTEMSHNCLRRALEKNLKSFNLPKEVTEVVVGRTFNEDPIFNIHHKHQDVLQLGTHHLRSKYWQKRFPYVTPQQVYLGKSDVGKAKFAHHISVKEALEVLLRDERIKEAVIKSFNRPQTQTQPDVLEDFTDGSAYRDHLLDCHGHSNAKCIQLLFFQDAFDPSAFAASSGLWKTVGFYWVLGNLPAKYRSKLDMIQMAFLVLERYFNVTLEEEVKGIDKWKEILTFLLTELKKLKSEGIMINGEKIPVCVLFFLGDNLGQHQIGGFIRNFSNAAFFCRYCVISRATFCSTPWEVGEQRSIQDYDDAVKKAKRLWDQRLREALEAQSKARDLQERRISRGEDTSGKRRNLDRPISFSAFQKLKAINFRGVKYHPSPLNSEDLQFHVSSNGLPPCLAHEFFEGIIKTVLPKILKHVSDLGWFDLAALNRRIKSFSYKGADARDAPLPLKSFDKLPGSACEIWTLMRLLPLLIGDLIKDKEDPFWRMYLLLKDICQFVCAPKIHISQIMYLKTLIGEYLSLIKKHLPACLTPKHHFLCHYPDLILIFGPLIRVFTLRFESKHKYFKDVIRQCKNFINLTSTLSKNYVCRFAYDHSSGNLMSDDLTYIDGFPFNWQHADIPLNARSSFPQNFLTNSIDSVKKATLNGITYQPGDFVILKSKDYGSLEVGAIFKVLVDRASSSVHLLLEKKTAVNTFDGLFKIISQTNPNYDLLSVENLPDYYPLPSYDFRGYQCIALKHSSVLEPSL